MSSAGSDAASATRHFSQNLARAGMLLETAMSVILHHRAANRRRRFIVSAVIPYCYILSLGFALLLVALVAGSLRVMQQQYCGS